MDSLPVIKTRRLLLRPPDLADAVEVQRLAGDRAIADTTARIPHPYEDGMAEDWIRRCSDNLKKRSEVALVIVDKNMEQVVGAISLEINATHNRAELGYWIGTPYWGRGYATEAARAVLDLAFGPLQLNRVEAHYFSRNPASGRVLEKIGMTREGLRKQAVRKWGRYEDIIVYAIVRADWLALRPSKTDIAPG